MLHCETGRCCYDALPANQRRATNDLFRPQPTTQSPAAKPADAIHDAHHVRRQGGLSLRIKINLIFSAVTIIVFAVLIAVEITATRTGVREEMEASGRIAAQLLGRIGNFYASEDLPELAHFLQAAGRVRANDLQGRPLCAGMVRRPGRATTSAAHR